LPPAACQRPGRRLPTSMVAFLVRPIRPDIAMPKLKFPTVEEVIEVNRRVLRDVPVKKGDRHQMLSRANLERTLEGAREVHGDVYDAATEILVGIIQGHPFASGVRRTAVTTTSVFLEINGADAEVPHAPAVLTGIREGFYNKAEVKNWLKGNGIRKRPSR
jgi:prophage maintenance system killer protein